MYRVSSKAYFVHVLWSSSARKFYIGISKDVDTRVAQHNDGVSKWSSKYGPWRLVHPETHPDFRSARIRENYLKRQRGGRGFYQATGIDPQVFRAESSLKKRVRAD